MKGNNMYYTLNTTIGTEIVVGDTTLVVGNVYDNKMKAPKDVQYILAFSKTESGWRFDGSADLDFELFCKKHVHNIEGLNVDDFEKTIDNLSPLMELAWKTERINIQAKIRPSKDSKKAERIAKLDKDLLELKQQLTDEDITVEQYADKCRSLLLG
jgi:hypothetical protein